MKTLLLLTICGTVMIAIGLLGLYADVTRRLNSLEKDIKENRNGLKRARQGMRNLSDKLHEESENVTFVFVDDSDVIYPHEGGL